MLPRSALDAHNNYKRKTKIKRKKTECIADAQGEGGRVFAIAKANMQIVDYKVLLLLLLVVLILLLLLLLLLLFHINI